MSRSHYAIRSKVKNREGGVNDSWLVTSDFIAKANSDDSPYLIANEVIAGSIAQFLRLPVPPFGLMRESGRHKGHKMMFASLRFTRSDTMPDDFPPDICSEKLPDLCTGILLFDALVVNSDRHRYNIQCDSLSNPRKILIFDHDQALFGGMPKKGIARLESLKDRLGITGGNVSHGNRHCLLDHLGSTEYFAPWLERIEAIPDWFIREVCEEVRGLPAKRNEIDKIIEFLIERKKNLQQIVVNHNTEFKAIDGKSWGLCI